MTMICVCIMKLLQLCRTSKYLVQSKASTQQEESLIQTCKLESIILCCIGWDRLHFSCLVHPSFPASSSFLSFSSSSSSSSFLSFSSSSPSSSFLSFSSSSSSSPSSSFLSF